MKHNIVLGIHIGHDRSAAIIKDGKVIGNIAQERLDRIKHSRSNQLPFDAIDSLLKYHGITIEEISCVGFSGDAMEASFVLESVMSDFYNHYKCSIPIYAVSHHDSHAYAAFYSSNFSESLILIADGGGDYINNLVESESLYVGSTNGIIPISKRYQHPTIRRMGDENNYLLPFMPTVTRNHEISIARKYEQFTYLLGFGWGQAGKTMGLASYGKSLVDFSDKNYNDLNFSLKYEDFLTDLYILQQLSGLKYHDYIKQNAANIAQTVQEYTEKAIIGIIKGLVRRYKINHLCLGGGLFLNCLLNHKILENCDLDEIFILPATGDDGQALGNAYYAYIKHFGTNSHFSVSLPYLGLSYNNEDIEKTLQTWKLNYTYMADDELAKTIVSSIANNDIVAFHHGRSEIGPRALCHRSILANPTNPEMKDIINNRVKHREAFRPFAPVVTEEMELKIFNLKQTSPYMLFAPTVKEEYRDKLPAITHIDNTARVQSISQRKDPFLHKILMNANEILGVPVLLNTSFNVAGQPIVESPDDAIQTFLCNDIDALAIGNFWITKSA